MRSIAQLPLFRYISIEGIYIHIVMANNTGTKYGGREAFTELSE